jgi:CheY-like chemotaxis protein
MITTTLRIILVEDVQTDAEITIHSIKNIVENPLIKVVDNLTAYQHLLHTFIPDLVISDYNLPTCTGLEIMELTKSIDNSIPLIFLTGALEDEELAANTILSGASGFILKKHMKQLDEKLKPLLKKIVFNMEERDEVRDKIRRNKIAVNQIYQYLDNIKSGNLEEQKNTVDNIKKQMDDLNNEN